MNLLPSNHSSGISGQLRINRQRHGVPIHWQEGLSTIQIIFLRGGENVSVIDITKIKKEPLTMGQMINIKDVSTQQGRKLSQLKFYKEKKTEMRI